jgi:hypothetical protein
VAKYKVYVFIIIVIIIIILVVLCREKVNCRFCPPISRTVMSNIIMIFISIFRIACFFRDELTLRSFYFYLLRQLLKYFVFFFLHYILYNLDFIKNKITYFLFIKIYFSIILHSKICFIAVLTKTYFIIFLTKHLISLNLYFFKS